VEPQQGDPGDEAVDAGEFWSGFSSSGDFRQQLQFARSYERRRPDYLLFNRQEFEAMLDEIRNVGFALADFCVDIGHRKTEKAGADAARPSR
jgi:hypothetical protein